METNKCYMSIQYDEDRKSIIIRSHADPCYIRFLTEEIIKYDLLANQENDNYEWVDILNDVSSLIVHFYRKSCSTTCYNIDILWQAANKIASYFIRVSANRICPDMWDITDLSNIKYVWNICDDCGICDDEDEEEEDEEIYKYENDLLEMQARTERLENELFPNDELSMYSQIKGLKTQISKLEEEQSKKISDLENKIGALTLLIVLANQEKK